MSTSIFNGGIPYAPAQVAADRFCDTGVMRDGVLNNALHQADESAQHIITWTAPVAAVWTADSDPFAFTYGDGGAGALRVGVYYVIPTGGAYAARVRSNGDGYRLRITLGGRSSGGHAVDFVVMAKPRRSMAFEFYGELGEWPYKIYSTSSTSVAMLTAADGHRWLDIPKRVIDVALAGPSPSTFVDLAGASISLHFPHLSVVVLAKTANAASIPELHLVTAHEVIGDA